MLNFLIYSGSARQGNFTQHVAQFVLEVLQKRTDLQAEIVSPKSLHLNFDDEGTQGNYPELRAKVAAADGYIIVAPEYNHSYSGSLKYMLDLNFAEYKHKPAGFVGVSMGPFGGVRMIEILQAPVRAIGLVATLSDVQVSNVQKEIVDGKFADPAKWEARVNKMLDELAWMTNVLKDGREKYPLK